MLANRCVQTLLHHFLTQVVEQGVRTRLCLVQRCITGVGWSPGIRLGPHAKRLAGGQRVLQPRDVRAKQRDRFLGVLKVEQPVAETEIEQAGLPP